MTEPAPVHETVGHALQLWETTVDAARQQRHHAAAGVDGALYGEAIDASVLANDCLHGARPRDALGATRLHAGVRVVQTAPVTLATPLCVRAVVNALVPARRGRYIHIDFRFEVTDGPAPIRIDHRSLILDPTPPTDPAPPKPPADETPVFRPLRQVQLTPEMVTGYSAEFPHLEGHHDPEAAARIGMRAPIAQGLMGFTLLLAERMRIGRAAAFDVEARFVRPVFWDDLLTLEASADGGWLRATNADGKTVSELRVHSWAG